jgi:peptide/nickel transport system substrate-binding protein
MKRRQFLAASAAALALPSVARSEKNSVLKYVPIGDLPTVDPIVSVDGETRNHGFMVFDTLYGQAGAEQGFAARPQMVAGHTIENDGRTWRLSLRDGLVFHDGSKVLARDCVASIRRWSTRDLFGQTLMQRTDELTAPDDRTLVFRLSKPFNLLPDALGKFGYFMCAIMPERLANTDSFKSITEVIGSGPFRFKADERVPGSLYVYERFEDYKPREGDQADFISGPKVAHFGRVEWHINPDQASVTGALQSGEIDWIQFAHDDLRPMLRRNGRVTLQRVGSTGFWGLMRPNHLFPPFDNPAIRRALMGAIDQTEFMTAVIGPDPSDWRVPTGFFPLGSPMASDEGLAALTGPRDLGRVRRDVEAAGYRGEKIKLLAPANAWGIKAICDVAADTFKKVGMNVDAQVMDGGTLARTIFSKKPPDEGGWNVFCAGLQGTDAMTPATHRLLRGNGGEAGAAAGWPSSPRIEALRGQWLDAPDVTVQRKIAAEIQAQAFIDVPYFPLGTWYPETAFRSDLTGVLDGQALFWNVRRQG